MLPRLDQNNTQPMALFLQVEIGLYDNPVDGACYY